MHMLIILVLKTIVKLIMVSYSSLILGQPFHSSKSHFNYHTVLHLMYYSSQLTALLSTNDMSIDLTPNYYASCTIAL